jgi:hypothetical protein
LLLAQTCVAEIDLQASSAECVVMWSINLRTAEQRSVALQTQTLDYNSYWDPRTNKLAKRWIGELLDGQKPEHWPAARSWAVALPLWRQYLATAREFVAHPVDACMQATQYGGTPGDGVHADDDPPCPYARRVRCLVDERQAYWNTRPCRAARRRGGALPASVAAGRPTSR